jgi:hypothetical protein
MSHIWHGRLDTNMQDFFYKISTIGEIKIKKKIGNPLYHGISYKYSKNISDGYLLSGLVDTTRKFIKTLSSNTSMTAKIDTNGNVLWKSFMISPDGGIMGVIASCEDEKRGGYWSLAGNIKGGYSYLYFIDKKGKPTFVTRVKYGDNTEGIFPHDLWLMNDGGLFVGFGYSKAQIDYIKASVAWGVSYIEAAEINKILATAEPDILPSFLVNIYPNPARDLLNISVAESDELLQIECFDIQGRAVYHCDFQGFTQINVSDWQRGLYAYVIRDTRGRIVKTEKILIAH